MLTPGSGHATSRQYGIHRTKIVLITSPWLRPRYARLTRNVLDTWLRPCASDQYESQTSIALTTCQTLVLFVSLGSRRQNNGWHWNTRESGALRSREALGAECTTARTVSSHTSQACATFVPGARSAVCWVLSIQKKTSRIFAARHV